MKRVSVNYPRYDLEQWNALNPVGSPCILVMDDGAEIRTRTRSAAWRLGHGQEVVSVEGRSGGYDLDRIRILESHDAPAGFEDVGGIARGMGE